MTNEQKRPEDNTEGQEGAQKKSSTGSGNAANLDAIISSPTDAARGRRSSGNLGNTGTNVSYEGPTAPGSGGSAGTGYASGQDATGARITTTDSSDHATNSKPGNEAEKMLKPDQKDDDLDRDITGTP